MRHFNVALTRRALIGAGGALGLGVILRRSAGETPPMRGGTATTQTIKPVHSDLIYQSYGVCSHPNFTVTAYGDTAAWVDRLGTLGAAYFRGLYVHQLPSTMLTATEARRRGIGWLATVAPSDWSLPQDQLQARLTHIRDNAANVIIAIEGVNEPNNVRGGGARAGDWAERTVATQKAIYEFVQAEMPGTPVVGPSLHAAVPTAYDDHLRLGELGVQEYFDYAGLHRYPDGNYPTYRVDERLDWIRKAFGDVPTWITETGYTNALGSQSGQNPVPEDVSAAYAAISLLELYRRGCRSVRYELLDDPDPDRREIEANFGLWRTASLDAASWTEKPEVGAMQSFLASLIDPGQPFTPEPLKLKMRAPVTVQWLVTGKRSGETTVLLWQAVPIYDPELRHSIAFPEVEVEVGREGSASTVLSVPPGQVIASQI